MRSPRWLRPLSVLALALLPTLTLAVRAVAEDADEPPDEQPGAKAPSFPKTTPAKEPKSDKPSAQRRAEVLAAMPRDATVLINVTSRDLPASPDILLLGRGGVAALTRCLADNTDAKLRIACAMLLGRIGDRQALPALQTALDDWDAQVCTAVVEALGRIPDASSIDPLIKLYKAPEHRPAILTALGAISHKRSVAFLRKALFESKDGDIDAFNALWTSRHVMSRDTLIGDVDRALGISNAPLQLAATHAAAELRSPRFLDHLVTLLDASDPNLRNKAVHALGLIGDKAATKALLAKLPTVRDGRMLNNIAFALERLDRGAFYASIKQLVEHKQAILRLNSAFVLGDVKRPEGLPMLEKALSDPSDLVKTTTVVALGKIGDKRAVPRLEPLVDSANASLKEEAVYAIFAIAGKEKADLLFDKVLNNKQSTSHQRAALALAEVGDTRVRDYVLDCLDQDQCSPAEVDRYLHTDKDPRIGGRLLLSWARGRSALTGLLAELRPDGVVPIAASAMDADFTRVGSPLGAVPAVDLVGAVGNGAARARLNELLAKPEKRDPWLTFHALTALARLGDTAAPTALLEQIDHIAVVWLPRLAGLMGRIEEKAVRDGLTPELVRREQGPDIEVALAAAAIRLAWDADAAFPRFLAALASSSAAERTRGEEYVNRNRAPKVTWLLRAALAHETRADVKDRLRSLLDRRPG